MAIDHLLDRLSQQSNLPNQLTTEMGELVKRARLDAGLTQTALAEKIYRRRASLSDIENGKMRMDVETLVYLARTLNKSILYFFPDRFLTCDLGEEQINDQEHKLLMGFRALRPYDMDRVSSIVAKFAEVEAYVSAHYDNNIRERVEHVGGSLEELNRESVKGSTDTEENPVA